MPALVLSGSCGASQGPKYTSAGPGGEQQQDVQYKEPLDVGSAVMLVLRPVPPPPAAAGGSAAPLATYGLPFEEECTEFEKDKKGAAWIKVSMMGAPVGAVEGSPPLEGFLPLASVECPGLLLNYDYLAAELLGGSAPAYPAEPKARAICDRLLAQRFLTKISRVAYPLLGVDGPPPVENTDAFRSALQRAYHGAPARGKRGPGSTVRPTAASPVHSA